MSAFRVSLFLYIVRLFEKYAVLCGGLIDSCEYDSWIFLAFGLEIVRNHVSNFSKVFNPVGRVSFCFFIVLE